MIKLQNHPFITLLEKVEQQTKNIEEYELNLKMSQQEFKDYLYSYFTSDPPSPQQFTLLKSADYELTRIRMYHASSVKQNMNLYNLWVLLIIDTRRYISTGIEILTFYINCPINNLSKSTEINSVFKWIGTRNNLTEAIVGLYKVDVIRMADGTRPSFALFAKFIGGIFGLAYNDPHDDLRKINNRKGEKTPFLLKIINCVKGKPSNMKG